MQTKKIGCNIANQRKMLNISQSELAETLGIGVEAVSRIERGVTNLNVARLTQIAKVMQCPISQLLGESNDNSEDQFEFIKEALLKLEPQDRLFLVKMVKSYLEAKLI